jgi:hypothetical protein
MRSEAGRLEGWRLARLSPAAILRDASLERCSSEDEVRGGSRIESTLRIITRNSRPRPMGGNNFSFVRFDDLRSPALVSLFAEANSIFRSDPENPVRYMQGM